MVCCIASSVARAAETPLYERKPFDLVVVRDEKGTTALEVLPLKEEIAIPSASIERVELFEEQLLAKAKEFAAKGDFNSAYPYFAKLDRDSPKYPGLAEAFTKPKMMSRRQTEA